MIDIPKELDNVLKTNEHREFKSFVIMYRNKWNSSTQKYEIENTPIDLTEKIVKPGNLTLQLDVSEINKYDASNVDIIFENTKNEFVEGVPNSLFPEGYLIYGSKFEYYVGISKEIKVLMYTGTIVDLPTYRTEEYQVIIRIVSSLELFKNFECSEFSNKVYKEELTGTWPNYNTKNLGVGNINKVYAGQSIESTKELQIGIDYKISDLNEMLSPANIEIINTTLEGNIFYADYYYWKKDLKIHEIINGLLDIVGIPEEKRNIEEVIFNSNVRNQIIGNNEQLGLGYYKEGNNDFKFNWFPTTDSNWQNYRATQGGSVQRRNIFPQNFEINFTFTLSGWSGNTVGFHAAYAIGNTFNSSQLVNNGMYITLLRNDTSSGRRFGLSVRQVTGGSYSEIYFTGYSGYVTGTERVPCKIKKIGSTWDVFLFGNRVGSFNKDIDVNLDVLYSSNRQSFVLSGFSISVLDFNGNILYENITNPSLISNIIDKGNSIDIWGAYSCTLPGINFTYSLSYAVSENGIDFGPWTSVDINTDIAETSRYIKFQFSLINPPPNGTDILNLFYTYLSNMLILNFVNLSGKTVLEAIEDFSLITGYEFGFNREDVFFFRQRIKSTEAIKSLTDNEIKKVNTVKKNIKNLFTKISINFGGIPIEVSTNLIDNSRPTLQDKYGIITKSIDKPEIINFDNPELANAIAPQLLETFGTLTNTIGASAVLDLSLDLGDVISLQRNSPLTIDKNRSDYVKFEELQTFYVACKIIGMIFDLPNRTITYTLLDVSNNNNKPDPKYKEFPYIIMDTWDYV